MDEPVSKVVLQAIQQRLGGKALVCGLCGGTRWASNGIVNTPVNSPPGALVIGGKHLPLVDMTCQICGLTQFHNIIVLLGREKFDEIVEQQKIGREAVNEAENIVKQKEVTEE